MEPAFFELRAPLIDYSWASAEFSGGRSRPNRNTPRVVGGGGRPTEFLPNFRRFLPSFDQFARFQMPADTNADRKEKLKEIKAEHEQISDKCEFFHSPVHSFLPFVLQGSK